MTVIQMARSMLKEKDLPKKFQAETISIIVYILNRCPIKAMIDKITS